MKSPKSPKFRYDPEYDTLEIILRALPAFSDELIPGVYIRYSTVDDEVVGATILSYSLQDRALVSSKLPFAAELPSHETLRSGAGV